MAEPSPEHRDDAPVGELSDRFERLPRPIVAKLEALIRRVRRVALLKGLFATLAVAAAGAIAIMAVDSLFTIFNDTFRTALSVLALLATCTTAYFQIWRPLRRRIQLSEIARAVESRHPELEERLSSAVELLGSDDPEALRGSEQMLAEVVKAASLDAKSVRPGREFSARRARKPMLAAAAATAVIGGSFLLWPDGTTKLLTRAFAPFLRTGNAYSDALEIRPGDTAIPEGGTLTIEVELDDPDATTTQLRRRLAGGADAVERMTYIEPVKAGGKPRFSLTMPAVGESFEYRIHSGRALSRYFKVDVIPRPAVLGYQVTYQFPAYTQRDPFTETPPGGQIAALVGTTARLAATLDRPVKTATLMLDGSPIWQNQQSLDAEGRPVVTWEFAMLNGLDGSWSVQLEDAAGIRNRPGPAPVKSIADATPTVRISSPSTPELVVKPTEIVPLGFVATEDYGFLEAQLLVKVAGNHLPPMAAPLPKRLPEEEGRWSGSASLDLRDIDLSGSRSLEVRIRLADNRPDPAGEAISDPVLLVLDRNAKSLLEQTLAKQYEALHADLWAALEKLMRARDLAADKPAALVGTENPSAGILLEIQEVGILAGESEALVRDSAEAAALTLFETLGPRLAALATGHIEPARAAAEAIPLTDREIGRVHQARTAVRELEESIAELGAVLRELKRQAERARMTAELGDLESRKDELARFRDRQTDSDSKQNLQEQIDELEAMAIELMKRSGESLADQFKDAGKLAEELAKRAAELAQDQEKLAELLALADDLSARENLIVEFIRWLESEQRAIAVACVALGNRAAAEASLQRDLEAAANLGNAVADGLTQNLLTQAALNADKNATNLAAMRSQIGGVGPELRRLASWQKSIAAQMAALGGGDLDSALAEMQQELADLAADLAEDASEFEEATQGLADPAAAQQAMEAAQQIAQAASDAAQANSQLGGQTGGSFQFANNPNNTPDTDNTPPDIPRPTPAPRSNATGGNTVFGGDAQFRRDEPPPDLSKIDGDARTPFEIGEVGLDQIPPALIERNQPQGGELPPGYLDPIQMAENSGGGQTSGRASGAGGAAGSGAAAGAGLGGASGALSGAASSLSSQAETPMAQQQPEPITPEMAQERMEELAAQVARQTAPASTGSGQEWARVGGQVSSGLATGARGQPPAEYRDMVKRYFEEIARRSNNPEDVPQ